MHLFPSVTIFRWPYTIMSDFCIPFLRNVISAFLRPNKMEQQILKSSNTRFLTTVTNTTKNTARPNTYTLAVRTSSLVILIRPGPHPIKNFAVIFIYRYLIKVRKKLYHAVYFYYIPKLDFVGIEISSIEENNCKFFHLSKYRFHVPIPMPMI